MLIALTLAAAIGSASDYTVRGNTVHVGYRPGGYTLIHKKQAARWLKRGMRIVIHGDQVSAAAKQVVVYRRAGGDVCVAKPGILLWFHRDDTTGPLYAVPPAKAGLKYC